MEAVQERLDREPERMRARRETVEHPFGTIKSWKGIDPLPDSGATVGEYGDEPACAGL